MEKEIGIIEYKEKLLEILDDIDLFCRNNNILYFLDSGTLLGAIRHNGYIPWDDDIDLIMPRKDYETFISSYKSQKCSVLTFKNNNRYYYQYAKVVYNNSRVEELLVPTVDGMGINIDVFPIDGMPDNLLLRRIHQDRLMLLSKLRTLVVVLRKRTPSVMHPFLRWRWIVREIDRVAKKYKPDETKFCGNIVASLIRHKEIPKECFEDTIFHVFEGKQYPIPSGYDKYLHLLYGDYMQLPPESKRVTNHHVKAFLKEEKD